MQMLEIIAEVAEVLALAGLVLYVGKLRARIERLESEAGLESKI